MKREVVSRARQKLAIMPGASYRADDGTALVGAGFTESMTAKRNIAPPSTAAHDLGNDGKMGEYDDW